MGNNNSGNAAARRKPSAPASSCRKSSFVDSTVLKVNSGEAGIKNGHLEHLKTTQSMYELDGSLQRRRRQSIGGAADKKRLAVGRLNSVNQEDHCINGHGSNKPTTSAPTSSSAFFRQRSVRKSEVQSHPISANGREIIQFCFENAHPDLGFRICNRVFDKRPDYQKFVHQLGREKWPAMTQNLKEFLDKVVAKIDNLTTIERLSRKYGEDHVSYKNYGFKPDFWVTLADAITVEAVILDMATHQPTDTVTAWSLFVSILFSHIRDGYYSALRVQRISTRRKSIKPDSVTAGSGSKPSTPTTPQPAKLKDCLPLSPPPRNDSAGSNRLEAKISGGSGGQSDQNQNLAATNMPLF